jgi:hypothetical protein
MGNRICLPFFGRPYRTVLHGVIPGPRKGIAKKGPNPLKFTI